MSTIKFLDGSEKQFETLVGADLRWADLWQADLRGANLQGADLGCADLIKADLEGANLAGVCFTGANLKECKNIVTFQLTRHFGYLVINSGYLHIGCEGHSLQHWLENYEAIGKRYSYTPEEIDNYGHLIKMLNVMYGGK